MTCLCAQKLKDLLAALANLKPPPIELPLPLEQLGSMPVVAPPTPAMTSQLNAMAGLPPLALSPATLSQLSAVGQASASLQSGLGIDPLAPNAGAALSASVGAINANAAAFLPLGALDPTPWLPLSTLASAVLSCRAAFGIDLLASGAAPALSAALKASVSAPPLPMPPGLDAYASLASASASLGVNLGSPGAMSALAANANAVASLSIPPITVAMGALASPLALLSALANILAGLALDPFAPGFASAALQIGAGLPAFEGIEIPAELSAGAHTSSGLSMLAGISPSALASLNTSALVGFTAPNLGPLTALASFSATCSAAGFPVAATSACGPTCPL